MYENGGSENPQMRRAVRAVLNKIWTHSSTIIGATAVGNCEARSNVNAKLYLGCRHWGHCADGEPWQTAKFGANTGRN